MRCHRYGLGLGAMIYLGMMMIVGADTVTEPEAMFGLGDLKAVAVSMDGRHLATAGRTGAYLWDLESGALRHRLETEGGNVPALAFSPDSRVLLTAGDSRVVRAWDAESGTLLNSFTGHQGEVQDLEFAPDGRTFVSASADNTARVWSVETGETLRRVTVPGFFIDAAAFTPDGTRLVTATSSPSERIRVWDLESESTIRTLADHATFIPELGFVRSGHLVTAGDDSVVRVWDITDVAARLRARAMAGGLELSWNMGSLQRANGLDGQWESVVDAVSPWTVPTAGGGTFFRVIVP